MDYKYLLAVAVLCIVSLLASNAFLYMVHRKQKLESADKEKSMLEQQNRIEDLNKEVVNLSSLYDGTLEDYKKRTEFFSNITHELKTPLSVILGAIQLMERKLGGQNEEDMINRNFRIIRHNCYRLLRLTNNLLDLTKMEAGYLNLKPVNCDLCTLLEEIVQSVMPYASQKQLELRYAKPSEPIKTAVDIEKMERIILNLLSNSIKFTKPGGTIDVSSYMTEDSSIRITVKDSGVGIPAETQEEVFGRYKQAGNDPLLENEGCGIGLSLVKSFVVLHKGNINVISEKGSGCEFVIDLPLMHVNDSTGESGLNDYYCRISEAANIEFADMRPVAS